MPKLLPSRIAPRKPARSSPSRSPYEQTRHFIDWTCELRSGRRTAWRATLRSDAERRDGPPRARSGELSGGNPIFAAAIEIGPFGAAFTAREGVVRLALAGAPRSADI